MLQQKIDEGLKAGLNPARTLRRMGRDVIKDGAEVGQRRTGVAKPHGPCLVHTARTCSSVANSPRAAAAFEVARAACSSGVSSTGGSSSAPASRRITRAMSSCASGGRLRDFKRLIEKFGHDYSSKVICRLSRSLPAAKSCAGAM
ncbi:MAG TPA: hypothetical protein VE993_18730 [Stellaceae bacterium]|nr:hypothetical protein [Stellaceae bacterium]